MPYDLFISYAHTDNPRGQVGELREAILESFRQLAGRDLRVFFDEHDIPSMADWEKRIAQGLRESRLFVAVLSPSFFASAYCQREWEEYVRYEAMRQCLGEGVAPIYFVELPGLDGSCVDQRIAAAVEEMRKRQWCDLVSQKPVRIVPWHEAGRRALEDAEIARRLNVITEQMAERVSRVDRARQSPTNLYRHNPQFVGRTRELTVLREALTERGAVGVVGHRGQPISSGASATALHGLGGLGKTELALAYAHAFAWDYPGGRWLARCEGLESFDLVLRQLAEPRALNITFTEEEQKDAHLAGERVLAELSRRDRSLLVLDNVTHPELIGPDVLMRLPPQNHVHILATTRLGPAQLMGSPHDHAFVAVDELPADDALALIRAHQPEARFATDTDAAAARELIALLAGFTLAVETAAIYLGRHTAPGVIGDYTDRLRRELLVGSEASAADPGVAVRHKEKLLERTLAITFEALSADERQALAIGALLPADQVVLPWMHAVAGISADAGWQHAVDSLLSLRLFQSGGDGRIVRMHRLVQELVKKNETDRMTGLERGLVPHIKSRAELLREGWARREHQWEAVPLSACARQWLDREDLARGGSWLANCVVAGPLLHLGNFAEAEPLMRHALEVDRQRFDQYDPETAISLTNLADVLQQTNRLPEAEPLLRRALATHEQSFGPDHPLAAISLSRLASLLEVTNRHHEAEPLLRRALAIHERASDPGHPSVNAALALGNLASLLQDTNRMAEAEPLHRRALAILEQSLGPNHPFVGRSLNDLATVLEITNRMAEAEPLFRRALAIYERSFGTGHAKLAAPLNNLALLLANTNRLAEAEPLLRRALANDEEGFGPEHPNVASCLHNLGFLLERMNRSAEAEPLIRRALRIREQSFGPYHPKVAESLDNLATLPQFADRPAEAEAMLRRALAICEESLGPDKPEVAVSLNNLAVLLQRTNRLDEAEPLLRRALMIHEQSFGQDHPKVSTSLANLASLLLATNRVEEAEALSRRSLEILLRLTAMTGHQDPRLDEAVGSYAGVLKQAGLDPEQVQARLDVVGRPFGASFQAIETQR